MKWKMGFNSLTATIIDEANIWVRLPCLPMECWTLKELRSVLRQVGSVLKMDENTEKRYRTLFS
uniref:DUF4283 domain-containing protein n=1 Tax=Nelumbo nucifera TaxID=4432 RepID=A0A822ZYM1_NELNU|nr:TPA_asm: hypothetical protein HUJ06_016975 [Nelumbo nucifera]